MASNREIVESNLDQVVNFYKDNMDFFAAPFLYAKEFKIVIFDKFADFKKYDEEFGVLIEECSKRKFTRPSEIYSQNYVCNLADEYKNAIIHNGVIGNIIPLKLWLRKTPSIVDFMLTNKTMLENAAIEWRKLYPVKSVNLRLLSEVLVNLDKNYVSTFLIDDKLQLVMLLENIPTTTAMFDYAHNIFVVIENMLFIFHIESEIKKAAHNFFLGSDAQSSMIEAIVKDDGLREKLKLEVTDEAILRPEFKIIVIRAMDNFFKEKKLYTMRNVSIAEIGHFAKQKRKDRTKFHDDSAIISDYLNDKSKIKPIQKETILTNLLKDPLVSELLTVAITWWREKETKLKKPQQEELTKELKKKMKNFIDSIFNLILTNPNLRNEIRNQYSNFFGGLVLTFNTICLKSKLEPIIKSIECELAAEGLMQLSNVKKN